MEVRALTVGTVSLGGWVSLVKLVLVVVVLPAGSLTRALIATLPSASALTWAELSVRLQVLPFTVALRSTPPMDTVTGWPEAPELVPLISREPAASFVFK